MVNDLFILVTTDNSTAIGMASGQHRLLLRGELDRNHALSNGNVFGIAVSQTYDSETCTYQQRKEDVYLLETELRHCVQGDKPDLVSHSSFQEVTYCQHGSLTSTRKDHSYMERKITSLLQEPRVLHEEMWGGSLLCILAGPMATALVQTLVPEFNGSTLFLEPGLNLRMTLVALACMPVFTQNYIFLLFHVRRIRPNRRRKALKVLLVFITAVAGGFVTVYFSLYSKTVLGLSIAGIYVLQIITSLVVAVRRIYLFRKKGVDAGNI